MFHKLLRLALDSAAAEPEAEQAAVMLIRIARRHRLSYDQFQRLFGPGFSDRHAPKSEYPGGDFVINFGKYEGHTLDEIYEIQSSYLLWVVDNFQDKPRLRMLVANYLRNRGIRVDDL